MAKGEALEPRLSQLNSDQIRVAIRKLELRLVEAEEKAAAEAATQGSR